MILTVRQSDQPTQYRRDLWNWCYANGVVASEVADAIVVDTERGTLSVEQWLPVSQPGDPDFPELHRDENNRPLSQTRVRPLHSPLPAWIVTAGSEVLAA